MQGVMRGTRCGSHNWIIKDGCRAPPYVVLGIW